MNPIAKKSADQRKAQKNFRKFAFPSIKVLETKPILVQQNAYRIIGQQVIPSPLFSHFIVVDQEGVRANRVITEKVYMYISMVQLANHYTQMMPWLDSQKGLKDDHEIFSSDPSIQEDYLYLCKTTEEASRKLQTWIQQMDSLHQEDQWTEQFFKDMEQSWKEFWDFYENRLEKLFNVHTYMKTEHVHTPTRKSPLDGMYKEAHFNKYLFTDTISLHTPFINDIRDFIHLNGQLGIIKESSNQGEIIQKKEHFSYHFFKSMVYALVAILIIASILTFAGKLHITSVITTFIIVCVVFYFGQVHDKELLKSMETRLKTLRKHELPHAPIIRKKYKKEYKTYIQREQRQQKDEKPYQFIVSIAKLPTWIMIFAVLIIVMGLVSLPLDQQSNILSFSYVVFGLILGFLARWLPKMRIGQRKITLEPEKITVHKKVYESKHCNLIRMNSTYKHIYIHMNARPDPIKFYVPKDTRTEVYTHISKWCERNLVTFQLKR